MRNALAYATHNFFQDNGFVWVASPIITASDCEGAGEQFYVTTLVSISSIRFYRVVYRQIAWYVTNLLFLGECSAHNVISCTNMLFILQHTFWSSLFLPQNH